MTNTGPLPRWAADKNAVYTDKIANFTAAITVQEPKDLDNPVRLRDLQGSTVDFVHRKHRFGFSHALTPREAKTASFVIQYPEDDDDGHMYQLDLKHLSTATLNLGTGGQVYLHGSGFEVLTALTISAGEYWELSQGLVPLRRFDLDDLAMDDSSYADYVELNVADYQDGLTALPDGTFRVVGTESIPVSAFGGLEPLVSWASNTWLSGVTAQYAETVDFEFSAVIPVK